MPALQAPVLRAPVLRRKTRFRGSAAGLEKAIALVVGLGTTVLSVQCARLSVQSESNEEAPWFATKEAPLAIDGKVPRDPLVPAELPLATPAPEIADYRLGPGDRIEVTVLGRSELSGTFTLGPDGQIGLPLVGTTILQRLTREEARARIHEGLQPFFTDSLSVALDVVEYVNNKVYVLGRVEIPGIVELTGRGTLLQALASAGGLPVREFRSYLAKCAIIRGRDEILWIDLIDLLQGGNLALNVPLRNGDVVFIPDSEDTIVFVMGEVASPGAVPIKVRLTTAQALAHAGGPTEDADLEQVYLIREGPGGERRDPVRIDFRRLLESGDFSRNFDLQSGDILYVARNGLGNVSYVMRKLSPSFSGLAVGASLSR